MKTVLKCVKIGGGVCRINFPGFPVKKGVKFVKMSRIPHEKGVILNFWNGHGYAFKYRLGTPGT